MENPIKFKYLSIVIRSSHQEKNKYLGLANGIISKSKRHFYNVSTKANKTIGFLRQNLNISYITEKEQAYRFLIR